MQTTYFVYIIQSLKDESLYVGYTSNPQKRLAEHNSNKNKYTKGHTPYKLIHLEEYKLKKLAKSREVEIKSTKNIKQYLGL